MQCLCGYRNTRRPSPHPDWWRELYGHYGDSSRQLKVKVAEVPQSPATNNRHSQNQQHVGKDTSSLNAHSVCLSQSEGSRNSKLSENVELFSQNLLICESDSDSYGHANWSVFLKYCLDALCMATPTDVANAKRQQAVKSAEIAYVGEGSVGQEVCVTFWADPGEDGGVHFHICDRDTGALINYAYVTFFSPEEVQLKLSKL